jgi:hypothetical protein
VSGAGGEEEAGEGPEKCSERSDPLTNHEQTIKKPIPSTPGDWL